LSAIGLRAWRLALAALFAALLSFDARAQSVTTAETGHITGADRTARLIAGAKKEGVVSVYSSITLETMTKLTSAFEKKYGIKVELWRGGAGDILQRLTTESRGARYSADVVEGAAPDIAPLAGENLLQEVASPLFAELMPGAVVPGRPWVGSRLSIFVAAYNSNVIKRSDLPKTYDELLSPNWKGRIGIEANDSDWLMGMADAMGETRATTLLRAIGVKNGYSLRIGHTLLANLVASGELPFSLTLYSEAIGRLKRQGAPIEALYLAPTIVMENGAAVTKKAPHPYAAMLFLDFLLSEGQKILSDDFYPATNLKYQHLPPGVELVRMNVPKYLDQNAKWTRLYKDILAQQAH
jgi:iron(III) transport system substrate-binding protein